MPQTASSPSPSADTALEAATKTVELIRGSRDGYASADEWRSEVTKAVREMERIARSECA
jgi:hypothetical protein